jgi:hypothetical protein
VAGWQTDTFAWFTTAAHVATPAPAPQTQQGRQEHPQNTILQTAFTHLQEVLLYVGLQAGQPQVQGHPQHCAWVAVQHLLLQETGARVKRRCHLQ